jgi:hypothetical protein
MSQQQTIADIHIAFCKYNFPNQITAMFVVSCPKTRNQEFGELLRYTVKRPILKSSLLRQMAPLEYINTLFKKSVTKKPR